MQLAETKSRRKFTGLPKHFVPPVSVSFSLARCNRGNLRQSLSRTLSRIARDRVEILQSGRKLPRHEISTSSKQRALINAVTSEFWRSLLAWFSSLINNSLSESSAIVASSRGVIRGSSAGLITRFWLMIDARA